MFFRKRRRKKSKIARMVKKTVRKLSKGIIRSFGKEG